MRSAQRILRVVVVGSAFLTMALGLIAAPLPAPNGLLVVDVKEPFTPDPALLERKVTAAFSLFFKTNTYRQEAQRLGIAEQTLTIRYEGGGGLITAVRLFGFIPIPATGEMQPFEHTFAGLNPGESKSIPGLTLTATLSKTGDELVITGGGQSPTITCVETAGRFETPGSKQILLHASVLPKTAMKAAIGQALAPGQVKKVEVELVIHNGLEGYSGGQEIKGEDKVKKGAITVANLNDTNGDTKVDKDQEKVVKDGEKGRDEIDLMKLIVKKPVPDLKGNAKLKIVSGDIKLWEKSTKEKEITVDKNKEVEFKTDDLPKTLWIEARSPSAKPRDIELELEYKGTKDKVLATAVWVAKSRVFAKRQAKDGFPDNPVPGPGKDLPELTKATVLDNILEDKAVDGSRYGHGFFDAMGKVDRRYGGRILWEFKTQPEGLESLGVEFDVTRQIQYRLFAIVNGKTIAKEPFSQKTFPWLQTPAKDNEEPNDDGNDDDEQNQPSKGLLYSFDAPSGSATAGVDAFQMLRFTFVEWVRIKVNGEAFKNIQDKVEGSRASVNYAWHTVVYLKRGPGKRMVEDKDATSASEPVLTGPGDGTATIALMGGAVTEGFTATYELKTGKWTLTGTSGDSVSVAQPKVPAGTMWVLTIPKKITLTITQGKTAFPDKVHFDFSVFKTADAKLNETAEGELDVSKGP